MCSASSRRSKRSFTGGNGTPSASCSTSNQAAPIPRNARPDDTTSRVVTILARMAGFRYVTPVTSVPSLTRFVRAASAPRRVYASNISWSVGPSSGQLVEVVHHHHGVGAGVLGGDRDGGDPLEELAGRGVRDT